MDRQCNSRQEAALGDLARYAESLRVERDQLRAVCAEAYQLAGALGAPVDALDNLSAAANGEPMPHTTFLPVAVPDVVAQRDQLLAALKGLLNALPSATTHPAIKAARAAIAAVEQQG